MATLRLSPSRIMGVSRILRPEAQRFSPCLGLLAASSPHIVANLRCLPMQTPAAELARELFHQRTGSMNSIISLVGRRYGPVGATKSRSRAAYWITPSIMGAMTGLAACDNAYKKEWLTDAKIDEVLFSQGVECNYVNREWSGVSMVRYRKIVRLLAEDLHYQQIVSTSALGSFKYTLPITLAYVWEKATSKQCLLDYLLALESTMQQPILLPEFEELRLADSPLRRQWLESHFAPGEITAKAVFAASQVLLQAGQSLESTSTMRTTFASSPTQMISDATDTDTNTLHNDTATSAATTGPVVQNTGEALEVLAASYALERSFKTPIKLGRYAYGDGRPRPDCVEVVVREIFDALIYDPDSDRLCPEILPATTSPAVKDFYSALQRGEIDDISTLQAPRAAARAPPSDRAVNTGKQEKHKNHGKNPITRSGNEQIATGVPSAAAGGNIAAEIIVPDVAAAEHATKRANDSAVDGRVEKGSLGGGDSGAQQQQAQYWEATTAGRAWFHLCSELPGSDYLSSTSSASGNRQYELQPNMRNVCATVCALLGVAENAGASGASGASADSPSIVASALITSTTSTISSASWRLKDLETYWNQHCEHLHLPHRKIATTEGTVRFRAPFSDTETINREVGTIQFVQGQRSAIDIELESNHQLATVKHRLCVDPAMRLWNAKNRDLFAQFWQTLVGKDAKSCSLGGSCFSFADSSFVVASAVLNDNMIETLLTALQMQRPEQQPQSAENTKEDHVDSLVVQALLSCRWGEERRQVTDSTDPNSSSTLSVTDASLTTADAQRQQQQSIRMTVSALKLLAYVKDERILASLVRWILQEAPNEVGIESLAAALLHLPHNVRLDKKFHSVLATIYEAQQAALIQQMVLVGTEQCPAQSLFRKCDLPWRKMMTLVKFCIQNKLSVFKV